MTTAREILGQLKGVKRQGKEWQSLCPAHEDRKPSLSITEGDGGKALTHCHAGCTPEEVWSALRLETNGSGRREIAAYDYRDETGKVLYQSVRFEPKDFRQRRPDGQGGWDWKLNGTRRVLYRLPELLAANHSRTFLVVEGEKDCDRLAEIGLVATTNAGGAGKWRNEYSEVLRGRKVVILPDNDEPGRKHAAQVAASLLGVASSVKVVDLPGLPEKGDVSDWLALGNGIKELRELVEATNPFVLGEAASARRILTSYADFMSQLTNDGELIAFECYPGEVALIQSVTNKGKSTLIRNTSFCLTAGREFLPLVGGQIPRRVLLVNFEGACGRFQSDLRVMERIFSESEMELIRENFFPSHAPEFDDEPLSLSRHMQIFEAEARALRPDVLIIDTASAAFSIRNESDNSEVAELMKKLIRLARQLSCVVAVVHHIGKAKAEDGQTHEAAHRGRGASAWADFASAIFNLEYDQISDLVTLTCAKRKSGTGENYESVLRLDRETRWFSATNETAPRPISNREQVLNVLSETPLTTAGVEQLLAGKMSERTVRACLKDLVTDGLATQPKRGVWRATDQYLASLGKLGNAYRELPNCLTERGEDSTKTSVRQIGSSLCELPNLPNGLPAGLANEYQEPTKAEWTEAAKDPAKWDRLVTLADAELKLAGRVY